MKKLSLFVLLACAALVSAQIGPGQFGPAQAEQDSLNRALG